MKHFYFVSYAYFLGANHGFGTVEMFSAEEPLTFNSITAWTGWLNANVKGPEGQAAQCVIISFQALSQRPEDIPADPPKKDHLKVVESAPVAP